MSSCIKTEKIMIVVKTECFICIVFVVVFVSAMTFKLEHRNVDMGLECG